MFDGYSQGTPETPVTTLTPPSRYITFWRVNKEGAATHDGGLMEGEVKVKWVGRECERDSCNFQVNFFRRCSLF